MRAVRVSLLLAAAGTLAAAQSHPSAPAAAQLSAAVPSAHIVYTFHHPELQPSRYTITIDESGLGHFTSQAGAVPANDTDQVYPAPLDRQIHIDPVLLSSLFSYARGHDYFNENCERRGRLAFVGDKTITYIGPDGRGSCAFVWASDPALQRLSDQLNAVAFTLEIGRRLSVEMHYYPLSLYSELASLESALEEQRAGDLANIASQLRYIAADQDFMDRVRRRAVTLLDQCPACGAADERSAAPAEAVEGVSLRQ